MDAVGNNEHDANDHKHYLPLEDTPLSFLVETLSDAQSPEGNKQRVKTHQTLDCRKDRQHRPDVEPVLALRQVVNLLAVSNHVFQKFLCVEMLQDQHVNHKQNDHGHGDPPDVDEAPLVTFKGALDSLYEVKAERG